MGGCSVKILSYISASVQLGFCVIGLILVLLVGLVSRGDGFREFGISKKDALTVVIVCGVVCLVRISSLLALIVGIQQKCLTMVSIFVYTHFVFLVLCVIMVVAELILQTVNGWPIGACVVVPLICFSFLGTDILFFSPIVILHRRMRAPPIQQVTYNAGYKNLNMEV